MDDMRNKTYEKNSSLSYLICMYIDWFMRMILADVEELIAERVGSEVVFNGFHNRFEILRKKLIEIRFLTKV